MAAAGLAAQLGLAEDLLRGMRRLRDRTELRDAKRLLRRVWSSRCSASQAHQSGGDEDIFHFAEIESQRRVAR